MSYRIVNIVVWTCDDCGAPTETFDEDPTSGRPDPPPGWLRVGGDERTPPRDLCSECL